MVKAIDIFTYIPNAFEKPAQCYPSLLGRDKLSAVPDLLGDFQLVGLYLKNEALYKLDQDLSPDFLMFAMRVAGKFGKERTLMALQQFEQYLGTMLRINVCAHQALMEMANRPDAPSNIVMDLCLTNAAVVVQELLSPAQS